MSADARRAFDEAHKAQSVETPGHAKIALDFIRELYRIESPLWDREQPVTPEYRLRVRAERSAAIMDCFHQWLDALAPHVVPQSRLGRAINYTLGQWPKLGVFLKHGEVPLDNNRCENAIRPFVVGRKGVSALPHLKCYRTARVASSEMLPSTARGTIELLTKRSRGNGDNDDARIED